MSAATLGSAPTAAPGVAPDAPPPRRRVGVVVAAVLGVVALVALAVWGLSLRSGDAPPAPATVDASTDPDGLRALVLLLEAFDAEVDVGPTALLVPVEDGGLGGEPYDAVLWLSQVVLDEDGEAEVEAFATSGATVVAEVPSTFAEVAGGTPVPGGGTALGGCAIAALGDVEEVVVEDGDPAAAGADGAATARGCFGDGAGRLLLIDDPGLGSVVVLGTVRPFTNAFLDRGDNAVLATSLLAPAPGTRVLVLTGPTGLPQIGGGVGDPGQGGSGGEGVGGDLPEDGGGDEGSDGPTPPDDGPSLADQVPTGVKLGLLQVVVALVLYALWRGRRVGRPVVEPRPVAVASSELVRAVGGLLSRTGDPARAAALLRDAAARQLAARLGLPPQAGADQLADGAVRFGLDPGRVHRALAGPAPEDQDGLLRLAVELDAIRQEVTHGVPA